MLENNQEQSGTLTQKKQQFLLVDWEDPMRVSKNNLQDYFWTGTKIFSRMLMCLGDLAGE